MTPTLAPSASLLPALVPWASIRPIRLRCLVVRRFTFPSLQFAFFRRSRADESLNPTSLGTVHTVTARRDTGTGGGVGAAELSGGGFGAFDGVPFTTLPKI